MVTTTRVLGLLILVSLLGGGSAVGQQSGGISVYMPLEELARKADVIVRGTVRTVQPTPSNTTIVTFLFVKVDVKQVIKGPRVRAGSTLTLRTDGPHISTYIPFQAGEDVVLFLRRVPGEKTEIYETIGGIQGKVSVTNGRVGYEQISVEEFIRRIRRAL